MQGDLDIVGTSSGNSLTFSFVKSVARKSWAQWAMPVKLRSAYGLKSDDHLFITALIGRQSFDLGKRNLDAYGNFYTGIENEERLQKAVAKERCKEMTFVVSVKKIDQSRSQPEGGPKPSGQFTKIWAFDRSSEVVRQVLARSAGQCERCLKPAPFIKRADGTPYLEVHHTITLADGGDDTVANAEALCPNCHRQAHHG